MSIGKTKRVRAVSHILTDQGIMYRSCVLGHVPRPQVFFLRIGLGHQVLAKEQVGGNIFLFAYTGPVTDN